MALVVRPRLLLLDEPLLGLSPMMQNDLVAAIKTIRAETGLTIVMTEQFARPILPMMDYGYVIESGMLTMQGRGTELMENPKVRAAYFGV
jgi:branched-chain amino acid transport system ATP-binding protein